MNHCTQVELAKADLESELESIKLQDLSSKDPFNQLRHNPSHWCLILLDNKESRYETLDKRIHASTM